MCALAPHEHAAARPMPVRTARGSSKLGWACLRTWARHHAHLQVSSWAGWLLARLTLPHLASPRLTCQIGIFSVFKQGQKPKTRTENGKEKK